MLDKLQRLLIEQKAVLRLENPERGWRITQGFHQLQLGIFGVQILILGIITAVLMVFSGSTRAVIISNWFLVIGIALTAFALVFAERAFREEPNFLALLRFCILTSVSNAIPAMLATLALRFEGVTLGVLGLFISSLFAFFICWNRLELLAAFVPQSLENSGVPDQNQS
jgi:hypothetical protein